MPPRRLLRVFGLVTLLVLAALWYRRETVEEYASQAVVGGGAVLRGKEQGKSSIAAVKVDRFTLQRQPNHK